MRYRAHEGVQAIENGDRFVIGSVSEFVRDSALSRADEMLADRRTFLLSQSKWAEFQAALDAPPHHNPRIQLLLTEPGFFDVDPSSTASEKR
ncbi:MAG: DUF1778 domain-containing protein [Nitrospira sp. LK70]|nr:DUF1778 domain-containing protein [Nitrospira sp. LK70]